ncbi:leucine--tRNA ligase [Halorussus litoreus]|uniref:leucine--tRNA ligase n=1 Tax=Halorussus litoreus TaxID=1710536 RepID=UPI000E24EA2E|nr:leucine--tRNA ligase [Halorussus litoreus]
MSYDPREIETKWQDRWAREGQYEVDPQDDEATFVTVPYPYPSGGMHIGHARTYTVPDVYARYRRLQGDNVLFPIAWHVTGTPIVGAVERLKKGEADQLSVLKDTYDVPEDTLQDLETPMGFARYFVDEHYKKNMKSLGLSIDWRREFTTNDDRYSKFITWQYETLKERGLLEKGLHPVKYCTNEQNPVTTHDLLEGEEAEFQEYTLIKFGWESDGSDVTVPMATLRPETVYGVTNAYIDPDAEYARAKVDGAEWLVSSAAVEKFRLQERDVEVLEEFTGERLVGERVTNPVTQHDVLVLPADFVDADNATGVVMSVPAHSPDDWMALQEAKQDRDRMESYGIDPDEVEAIEPTAILDVEEYGEFPARDAVEEHGIDSSDDPALEDATQEVYNREFHGGVLREMYGDYAGEVVEDVRDDLKADYESRGSFDSMYEFSEEVVCRCGGDVEVAKQDTWFLRYNDAEWKEKTKRAVEGLDAIPENTREQYDHTIDWLNEWPAIRNYGLGTRLPWDDEFVIEPLSDSTIYMAYYTIAHRIEDVPVEELDRNFFDTLFMGPEAVDEPNETALDLREEWDYWYPIDYRCSANDLISNHLTFFLYHHAELFEEPKWPQGITVMGMGLLEGQKMSSSKGHVVLPAEAIEEYGADTVRFFLLNSAEPWQDYDWRSEQVQSTHDQLARFWTRANEIIEDASDVPDDPDLKHVDRWLLAKLQSTVREATDAMENFETRTASQTAFYGFEEHLKWYRKRADLDRPGAKWTLEEVLRTRLRLLAPFVPFAANELHERLDGVPVEDAAWPEPDPEFESARTEVEEGLIEALTEDVRDIVDVTETDPDTVRVYVAADWKTTVLEAVVDTGPDVGAVMGKVMQHEELREKGNEVNDLAQDLVEFVRERPDDEVAVLSEVDEQSVYESAERFLEREFDADVEVYREGEDAYDPADKAGNAVPFRPAVHLE